MIIGILFIVIGLFMPPVITTFNRGEFCEREQSLVNRNCTIFNTDVGRCDWSIRSLDTCRRTFNRQKVSGARYGRAGDVVVRRNHTWRILSVIVGVGITFITFKKNLELSNDKLEKELIKLKSEELE